MKVKPICALTLKSLFVAVLFAFLLSCDKDTDYPKDSIYGPWQCFQDDLFRPYDVSISSLNADDETLIIIRNFHNLGFHVETFATVSDTIIEIVYVEPYHDIHGTGYVKRDFTAIQWEYFHSGINYYSVFLRP